MTPLRSGLANELRRITADFLAVQNMKHPQLLDCFLAELAERDMNQFLAVTFGEASPSRAGWRMAEERDVTLLGVMAG